MGLGDMMGMLKGLQQAQQKAEEMRKSLEAQEVEGRSADGLVTARVNGRGDVLAVKIDPAAVDPAKVAALEEAVREAISQALDKSHELMQQEMGKALGGLNLPGLSGLLGKT
jgi:hypothetical protein